MPRNVYPTGVAIIGFFVQFVRGGVICNGLETKSSVAGHELSWHAPYRVQLSACAKPRQSSAFRVEGSQDVAGVKLLWQQYMMTLSDKSVAGTYMYTIQKCEKCTNGPFTSRHANSADRVMQCHASCSPYLHEYAPLGSFGLPRAALCMQWTRLQEGEHRRCRPHCRQSPPQAVDKIVGRRLSPLPPALPLESLNPAHNVHL